jgi:hypothetical protein
LASRRAAIRAWRESPRLLIMRSLVWYSSNLRKTQPKSNTDGRMRNFAGKIRTLPGISEREGWMLLLPRVDAQGTTGRQVGSLAERATAASPPGRHPLRADSEGGDCPGSERSDHRRRQRAAVDCRRRAASEVWGWFLLCWSFACER